MWILVLFGGLTLLAQVPTGGVVGRVTDSGGGASSRLSA